MNSFFKNKISNLSEAQSAMAKVLPHLPFPRVTEAMNCCGVIMPHIGADKNLPVIEQPETLIANVGPYVFRKLPEDWKSAYYHYKQRLRRNAQLLRLHPACQVSSGNTPIGLDDKVDGIVAGVLLLAIQPMPSPLRSALMRRTQTNWWGGFFAAHGLVFADEATHLLAGIANDPRLSAALWLENPDLCESLAMMSMRRNDLWSALIALQQPLAAEWWGRVCAFAANNSIAAVTALTLQPNAPIDFRNGWVARLQSGPPRLAYLAARWTKYTWPKDEWVKLRDALKPNAISDGLSLFHFFRDVQPEQWDEAFEQKNVPVLWLAELVHHFKSQGAELRRLMAEQLMQKPFDNEATFTLKWLSRRRRLS